MAVQKGKRAEVQGLLEQVVKEMSRLVADGHLRIYLFGSWAQGRALSVSDLDIALDIGMPISVSIMQDISDALEELPTLRKIDVVDLQAVDEEFRNRVLEHGQLIYDR